MKQLFLIATLLLTFKVVNSQIKIHKGDGTRYSNKVIFTIDGNKIRQGDGTSDALNKVLFSFNGDLFKQGDIYSSSSIKDLLIIRDNQIREANVKSYKCLLTIDGNKIRQGDGTSYSNKVLFTIDGNKIRLGDGTSDISNKVICTVEGEYFFTIGGTFYSVDGSLTRTKMACILYSCLPYFVL